MSISSREDRTSLCTFAFADGRHCTLPQSEDDMGLCYYHAQRHIDILKKHAAGEKISSCLDAGINTACDLSAAFTSLFCAAAQGYIKPKTAIALTYLGNLMLQTHRLAKEEYLSAFKGAWPERVQESLSHNSDPAPAPSPAPFPDPYSPAPPNLPTSSPAPQPEIPRPPANPLPPSSKIM